MSEWQTPKTDYDTDPEAPTGAIMNRIEENTKYLKEVLPLDIFYITGNIFWGFFSDAVPGLYEYDYAVNLPNDYELVLVSANYVYGDGGGGYIKVGDSSEDNKYFDSGNHVDFIVGDVIKGNEVNLGQVIETNETGVDETINIKVKTLAFSGGYCFTMYRRKI